MEYSDNNVKTIGLVVEDVFTDFAKEIIHSVVHSVIDRKDIKIVLIAGRCDEIKDPEDKMHLYIKNYNIIYDINKMCKFDGLLVVLPRVEIIRDKFKDIPAVYIAMDMENEVTANYDSEMGIVEAIDYLVKRKGYTNICMLGGRADNDDAIKRKNIFIRCLEKNGLSFSEKIYEASNMNINSQPEASRLLDRNPDVQAIFCVNDQSAVGLYEVLHSRGLIPGKDIDVFGFDNTAMSAEMIPPLASIGTDGLSLGQKALEMLMGILNGNPVESQTVPTRLFGRESFEYNINDYNPMEVLSADKAFVDRLFDECFYRYRNEIINNKDINLKRLFTEIISRMLSAMKSRYMSEEQFVEIAKLIDILFENGVMRYTDANRFVSSISRLQGNINEVQKSDYLIRYNNRLFSYMKDKAIHSQAFRKRMEAQGYNSGRGRIFDFVVWSTNYGKQGDEALEDVIKQFVWIKSGNMALYLFDEPFELDKSGDNGLPSKVNLKCVVRDDNLFIIPKDRQECDISEIYNRTELAAEKMGYISYPVFYGKYFFGILVYGVNRELVQTGEFITAQISKSIYENWIEK